MGSKDRQRRKETKEARDIEERDRGRDMVRKRKTRKDTEKESQRTFTLPLTYSPHPPDFTGSGVNCKSLRAQNLYTCLNIILNKNSGLIDATFERAHSPYYDNTREIYESSSRCRFFLFFKIYYERFDPIAPLSLKNSARYTFQV